MIAQFLKYYQKNKLFSKKDNVLLATSGGRDSMAMVHLFHLAQLTFGIAHCNFKLRKEEADGDEQLVKYLAHKYNVPFYSVSFDTAGYAKEKNISIQMAARDLRYDWFEEIRKSNDYNYVATAHHQNDVAETLLINLTKGTGIAGMHGIAKKRGKIIRPLLCFTRKEIENFVEKHDINYREDSSNTDTKYTRNKVRHEVLPKLEEINPSIVATLYATSQQFLGLEQILAQKIAAEKKTCFKQEGNLIKIEIQRLLNLTPLTTYLYYFIKDYGFTIADIENIVDGLKKQAGKTYHSTTHLLLKDRDYLILKNKEQKEETEFVIKSIADFKKLPFQLKAEIIDFTDQFQIDRSPDYVYLDVEKITFPLMLRKWRKGDKFQPLGLKGKKKVSDFFIDNKLSVFDKNETWLLLSNQQIIWLVGYRIDDRFKLTDATRRMLFLSI